MTELSYQEAADVFERALIAVKRPNGWLQGRYMMPPDEASQETKPEDYPCCIVGAVRRELGHLSEPESLSDFMWRDPEHATKLMSADMTLGRITEKMYHKSLIEINDQNIPKEEIMQAFDKILAALRREATTTAKEQ